MNIYIANIPFKANESELRGLFEEYGQVSSAKIIMDRETQRSRGFGFVEMEDDEEARAAISGLNGKEFMGKNLMVNEAKPKEPRSDFKQRSGGYDRSRSGDRGGWERKNRY